MEPIVVHKGRTVVVQVTLPCDVSLDTITSQIRKGRSPQSALIATWVVTKRTDGVDGKLLLTLDNSITSTITDRVGYMDLKRVSGDEPFAVFETPLQVRFEDFVTV